MEDPRIEPARDAAELVPPSVDEAAEHLLRVLPPMFKRVMGEARMHMAGAFPLGETQFRIIHALDHRDYTMGEMAEVMRVRTPTISRMVDTLVERGYIDRQPDPGDRRKVWIRLTTGGRTLAREAEQSFCWAVARFLQPLDGQDLAVIVAACQRLERLLRDEQPAGPNTEHIRED